MRALPRRGVFLAGCLTVAACVAHGGAGPLRRLFDGGDDGPLVRVATTDATGKNNDFVSLAPGQTITLMDAKGPGIVRHLWMTTRPVGEPEVLRGVVLRIFWDDELDPSVEAPIGDFFGVGFGERADVSSLLVTRMSGGMNCFWPMPFRRRARLTLTNVGPVAISSVYLHVDVSRAASVGEDEPYFHAHWHRARTAREDPYVLLDTQGAGSYVGTVLSMQNLSTRSLLFLEGNDSFQVDDERAASIVGTGTEDYFLSGWYFDRGPFSAWSYGATIVDPVRGRVSAFRWHVLDSIPYRKRLRVTIEDGLRFAATAGFKPNADYSSVAFYYQREPHSVRSSIAGYVDTRPISVPLPPPAQPGTSEAEDLMRGGTISTGEWQPEELGYLEGPTFSGNGYVAWGGAVVGAEMRLPLPVRASGSYEISACLGRAGDGVVAELQIDGKHVGVVSFFHPGPALPVIATGPLALGAVRLTEGVHELRLKITGTDPRMTLTDRFVYLDAIILHPTPGDARGDR